MAVIGRSELINRLRSVDDLEISPIISKEQLSAASVDLRMGNVVLMIRARGWSHVDPADAKRKAVENILHDTEIDRQQKHERYEIPFQRRFLLHPGSLALVPTLEWLKLPPDLQGTVTARSTWAREGLIPGDIDGDSKRDSHILYFVIPLAPGFGILEACDDPGPPTRRF